ncbi:T9SS type A sorting domain-containing protein [Taibaiella chishuiensis]|uniref:Putative secreted protein (Por secretion system target) n=1 Tax=Taibaiella chishuiensis TaxID=1434707 RepID=A0A2P8CX87_9BACT|nr:T9SS type A sorting domain-containing protein [Taibaiella chishuiensis]PSK89574.1 putative secreted protein (Por secretion system target) [Taibaiella chishuiensis]
MKKLFLLSIALGAGIFAQAQSSKNYRLTVVAEGNFGTPNGDVFRVLRQNQATTVQGPLYKNANSTTNSIDVLQDFDFWQTKAVICGKGAQPLKFAVVNYPAMDTVFTVTSGLGGLQRCGMVSDHKAYILGANSSVVKYVNIDNHTITDVSDPGGNFASGVHSMIGYNATMYVANGTKVVKIDTVTQATTGSIVTGLTGINTMVKDTANQCLWLLGKSGATNALVKIEVNNNNTVSAPILLTGFSNAKLLRVGPNKLYFVSGSGFYVYDLSTQTVPTAPVYTTPFTGFSVMYDRSFTVDPASGDFAYSTAGAYVAPGLFEIIDGTNYTKIDSGAVTGAAIPNELFLTTWPGGPSWDTTSLPHLYAQCSITLTAPTATKGTSTVTGTTTQMTYNTQGNHTIEWKYVSGTDSITQTQLLTIADTIAPVANTAQLADLRVNCPYTLTPPTATDNCLGLVTGTTDSLTFTVAGTYTLTWKYTDGAGNITTQQQSLVVSCGTSIREIPELLTSVYPNPANTELVIELKAADNYHINIMNALGQAVLNRPEHGNKIQLDVTHLQEGMYWLRIQNSKGLMSTRKIIIRH